GPVPGRGPSDAGPARGGGQRDLSAGIAYRNPPDHPVRQPPPLLGVDGLLDRDRVAQPVPVRGSQPVHRPAAARRGVSRAAAAGPAPRPPPGIRRDVADQRPDDRGRRLSGPFGFDMQLVHQPTLLRCTGWYMYHMVHLAMTTSQARDRLLASAVEQAMRGG